MANYQSQYTGEQIDEAVGKALAGGGGTSSENVLLIMVVASASSSSRYLKVYLDGDDSGVAVATLMYGNPTFIYVTGFTESVLIKGNYTDNIYVATSGNAVNCDISFSETSTYAESATIRNINGIGLVTIQINSTK